MNREFHDRIAVVTGAGSGIGRALAQQLADAGARLAISDISEVGLEQTRRSLPASCDVRTYRLDVGSHEAVFAHAEAVQADFGAAHYLFNNAGATMIGTFEHLDTDEIEWQLAINLWGVIYGCKAFLPLMREQGEGCLVNISSVFGLVGFQTQSAYNMSKFAVRGLTECLWQELEGTGIRAVCVHPGGIRTNIEASGRRCRNAGPEEDGFASAAQKMLITPPERCAADILDGIRRGRRRILAGNRSWFLFQLARWLPNHYDRVLRLLAPAAS